MSNGLRSLRNSNIFVHPVDLSEFYIMINLFADRWFDTSHKWTLAWLDSFLQSLVLTTAIRKVAAHHSTSPGQSTRGFHSSHQSLFNHKITGQSRARVIISAEHHFCGTRFDTFTGHLCEFLEAPTSFVNTYMIIFQIGGVLMHQKWYHFTKSLEVLHPVARLFRF